MRLPLGALSVLLACAPLVACGNGQNTVKAPLERWEAQYRDLFDDQIDQAAIGLSLSGRAPHTDPLLRLRATEAELVARMRVQTVTRDSAGARTSYVLTMEAGEPTLMPPKIEQRAFELFVDQNSASFPPVRTLENLIRTDPQTPRIFVGFIRRFAAADEGTEIHWHLTADTPEVLAVIQEIAVVEEVSREDEP